MAAIEDRYLMIALHTYLLFIGAVVVLVIAPGPDMAFMLARTAAHGRRAGVWAAIGINAGAYVHVAAAVLGVTAMLAASSTAFTIIKSIGGCYLVWIGLQTIIAKVQANEIESQARVGAPSMRTIFWQGFLSDVLNPKVAIFFIAFLPQFIDVSSHNKTQQLLLLGITGNVVAICINLSLVYIASLATSGIRNNRKITSWLNKALGGIFVALGARLVAEKL